MIFCWSALLSAVVIIACNGPVRVIVGPAGVIRSSKPSNCSRTNRETRLGRLGIVSVRSERSELGRNIEKIPQGVVGATQLSHRTTIVVWDVMRGCECRAAQPARLYYPARSLK